jgi:predicted HNH restriction endonuclease
MKIKIKFNRPFFVWIQSLFLILFLFACEKEGVMNLEMGKRYVLEKYPDSAYIANIAQYADTAGKTEMKKWESESKTTIKRDAFQRVVTPAEFKKMFGERKTRTSQTASKQGSEKNTAYDSQISFVEHFQQLMESLRSDPDNKSLQKIYTVKTEKNLREVLLSVYGAKAKKIPSVLALYQLRPLNSSVNLEKLKAGDIVILPKVP